MSGVEAGIWGNGQHVGDRYVSPSELSACRRCGVIRKVRTGRATALCRDCYAVTRACAEPEPLDGGRMVRVGMVWRFEPTQPAAPERMSAEDMAWCIKAAEQGKRLQQERANRRGYWTTERGQVA